MHELEEGRVVEVLPVDLRLILVLSHWVKVMTMTEMKISIVNVIVTVLGIGYSILLCELDNLEGNIVISGRDNQIDSIGDSEASNVSKVPYSDFLSRLSLSLSQLISTLVILGLSDSTLLCTFCTLMGSINESTSSPNTKNWL